MSRAATRIILTAFLVWSLIAGGIPSPGSAAALQPGQIGLRLQTAPPEKGPGAIVVEVTPGGPAAEEDVRVGDIVREVYQEEVSSPEEVVSLIQAARREGKQNILLLMDRDGDLRFVAMRISTGEATAEASPAAPAPVAPAAPRAATPPFKGAAAPAPSAAAPPSVATAPKPTAPTTPAPTGTTVIEPRLGMEFASVPGGKKGAVIVRNWNSSSVGNLPASALKPGDIVDIILYILPSPNAKGEIFEDGYTITSPGYIPSIIDGILASPRKRHDAIILNRTNTSENQAIAVGLLPTTSPVPAPPPVVVAIPAPAAPKVAAQPPAAPPAPVGIFTEGQAAWKLDFDLDFSISAIFKNLFTTTPPWIYILSIIFGLLAHRNAFLGIACALFIFFNVAVNFEIIQGGFIEYLYRPFYLWFVAPFLAIYDAFDASTSASGLALLALSPLLSLLLYGGAFAYVGPEVRQQEWERVARYLPRGLSQFLGGRPAASTVATGAPADAEEEEIALARRAVEEAEYGEQRTPSATVTEGPSWWQKRRERREVEQARLAMARAEQEALRSGAVAAYGGGPIPYPPPYGYSPPPRPLSEWLRTAYWAWKFLIVVVATLWLVWTGQSVLSALGALFPASLRAPVGELLHSFGDMLERSEQPRQ